MQEVALGVALAGERVGAVWPGQSQEVRDENYTSTFSVGMLKIRGPLDRGSKARIGLGDKTHPTHPRMGQRSDRLPLVTRLESKNYLRLGRLCGRCRLKS